MRTRFKPIVYFLSGVVATGAIASVFAFRQVNNDEAIVEVQDDNKLQYKWYPVETPKALTFAGEKVPLERWEVKERLDRELNINYYMHGTTLYLIRQSTRYFPMIEDILKANGVPEDFKYLCVAESGFQQVTSPAGASGFWQFMKTTAPRYGLIVNDEIDERYNVRKTTEAACKYFLEAYSKFNSWTAAAASYNCGMGGYGKQTEYQLTTNYYDLALPEETNRYVFRILALKCLLGNAKRYGYIVTGNDAFKPLKTKTITVDSTIDDLADFATENGSSYKMLKLANPWLRAHTLTVKPGKTYEIELPLASQ